MRNNQVIFGTILLGLGLLLLFGAIFNIDVWSLICPLFLILIGVWLLLRPKMATAPFNLRLLGDIRRHGAWQVADEDIWLIVGDVVFDMSEAEIPQGDTNLKSQGFVGSVKLRVPEGVGVLISSTAFVTDVRLFGQKQNSFVSPVTMQSPDYASAEKRIHLETLYFVGDIKIDKI